MQHFSAARRAVAATAIALPTLVGALAATAATAASVPVTNAIVAKAQSFTTTVPGMNWGWQ